MKIKVKIPIIEKPNIPENRFYNNIITYFLINGLMFSVIERKTKFDSEVIQFRLSNLNQKLNVNTFYSTISETIREMIINYILLPESEKKKIIEGDFIEKFKD
jgi:hypothetical protein